MTTANRRNREKKLRAEQILDAAEKLIMETSVESLRMDDVAEAAELSKGTLYLYYKSKTELAFAVHIRGMRQILEEIRKQMSQPGTGIEMIRGMSKIFFGFMQKHPQYYRLFLYFESVGLDVLKELKDSELNAESDEIGQEMQHLIMRAVQVGIQDGSIDSDINPVAISIHIIACYHGIMHITKFNEEGYLKNIDIPNSELSFKKMMDTFMDVLMRALKPIIK